MLNDKKNPQKTTKNKTNKETKAIVCSPDTGTDLLDIVAGDLQGDTFAPYRVKICLDDVMRTSTDLMKENGVTLKK